MPAANSAPRRVSLRGAVTIAAVLFLGASSRLSAQVTLLDPDTLPDATVTVSAPSVVGHEMFLTTIKVDYLARTKPATSGGRVPPTLVKTPNMSVAIDFTWLTAVTFDSPGLACQIAVADVYDWDTMTCKGTIPEGGSSTIRVWSMPKACNGGPLMRPAYTDAVVNAVSDRSTANNRVIARTDVTGCLN